MAKTDESTGMYKCSACGESFDSLSELRDHERSCQELADRATAGPK
jgi:hypothetical protein